MASVSARAMACVALGAAIIATATQAYSLVKRGEAGLSDIGVYYRTNKLLAGGVGADVYLRADSLTGWPLGMPPLGFAVFQPFALQTPHMASIGWAVFNLCLLAVICGAVWNVALSGASDLARAFPWIVVVLLLLSLGSLQVGQFSILFVACWAVALQSAAAARPAISAAWLALPAAIKLYPALLVAAPLSTTRACREAVKALAIFGLMLLLLSFAVPMAAYGMDAPAINVSWLQNIILNSAHLDYQRSLRAVSNQSLDTLLLRYLTYDPSFHDIHALPHLEISRTAALSLAHALRAFVLATTFWFVWRWHQATAKAGLPSAECIIVVFASWISAMYLAMPETKSRYAVYTFIAFLPWLADAARAPTDKARWRHAAGIAATIALVTGALPHSAKVWGIGFLGALALWLRSLMSIRRLSFQAAETRN